MPKKPTLKQLGIILLLLYFFSGVTSLAYEVLWIRMLSLQFGVSIFGVIVTVASFMAGLGVGSIFGRNFLNKKINPLVVFAMLEGAVAVLAMVMPWVLLQAEFLISDFGFSSTLATWYVIELLFVGLLLFVPAFLMGAGFPVILAAIKKTSVSLSYIYGINACGAAIGALLPLIILPKLGWLSSMHFVAGLGVMVAIGALILSRKVEIDERGVKQGSISDQIRERPTLWALSLYAGIGAAALMLEVGWTRLFGMIMLRTEYVVAIILAIFLIGIGVGSLLASHMRQKYWLTLLPIVSCSFGLASLWMVPVMSGLIDDSRQTSFIVALLWQGGLLALPTLPVTLALGAWLPLLAQRYGNTEQSGSLFYGYNSAGAAVGALFAGFVLTPTIGTSSSIVLASLLLLVLGFAWAHTKKAWILFPVMILVAVPVMSMPDVGSLLPQQYENSNDIYYHEDAITITHVVERKDGQRLLLADLQRMDASSDPAAVEVQKNQSRLPLLLHPNPESVLFLGLGTGISAAGSLPFPTLERTAIELSQGAINAARDWFTEVNDDVVSRLNIIRDDARHFLMSNDDKYDVVIGDLFHPDLVGRSALLSVQQFQRARKRLSNDGVFVQWLALNQFDIESLSIVLRSFKRAFPDGVIFVDAFRLALVGTNQFGGAESLLANLQRLSPKQQQLVTGGEAAWTWLGRYWGKINIAKGKEQQEWAPIIEFELPHARSSGELDLVKVLHFMLQQRPHLDQAVKELGIKKEDFSAFERAYVATELAHRSWLAFLRDQAEEGQRLLRLAYQANPMDRWIGFAVADGALASYEVTSNTKLDERMVMQSILKIRPDHTDALKRLWRLESKVGNMDKAREYRSRLAALSPLDRDLGSPGH